MAAMVAAQETAVRSAAVAARAVWAGDVVVVVMGNVVGMLVG